MTEKEKLEFANTYDENWLGAWIQVMIKTKKLNKHEANIYETAGDLAMLLFGSTTENDPKAYPKLRLEDGKAERVALWKKWTSQFNMLIYEYQVDFEDVLRVILYVSRTKYWSRGRYSAGYIRKNYKRINKDMIERR